MDRAIAIHFSMLLANFMTNAMMIPPAACKKTMLQTITS